MKNHLLIKKFDWQFSGKSDYHEIHLLHPYFAKFNPKLPRQLINILSKQNDTVLDPFCGSGTTLVEATLQGRNAVGIDANPLGCFFTTVKSSSIKNSLLNTINNFLDIVEESIDSYYGENNILKTKQKKINYSYPDFHNRDYWFTENALNELGIIKAHIKTVGDKDLRNFLLLSFSRIILYASNQQTESRYKRVDKKRGKKDIFLQYKKTLLKAKDIMSNYSMKRKNVIVNIFFKDSRYINFIKRSSIDLIITSPPYLNSWDYGLYHRFRFFWLDLNVHEYEEKEIGKHLRTLEGRSKSDEVERYRIDMSMCLKGFSKVLKKNKYCCIVNANSIVKKRFIDTNKILVDEAKKYNLHLVEIMDRKVFGPHYGMHASLNSKKILVESETFVKEGKTNKKEQILVFMKH